MVCATANCVPVRISDTATDPRTITEVLKRTTAWKMPNKGGHQRMKMEYREVWDSLTELTYGIKKELELVLAPTEIRYIEFQILHFIKIHGPSTLAELANELTITKWGVTFLVDGLEARGLLRRKKVEEGRMVVFIALTPLGGRKLNAALKLHDGYVFDKMGNLCPEQLNGLMTFMNALNGTP